MVGVEKYIILPFGTNRKTKRPKKKHDNTKLAKAYLHNKKNYIQRKSCYIPKIPLRYLSKIITEKKVFLTLF